MRRSRSRSTPSASGSFSWTCWRRIRNSRPDLEPVVTRNESHLPEEPASSGNARNRISRTSSPRSRACRISSAASSRPSTCGRGGFLNHNELLSVKRVVITGCGDSHMAGLATELAFEQVAGIPTEPMTAMQAGRYGRPSLRQDLPAQSTPRSASPSPAPWRERGRPSPWRARPGALTVAFTANPDAPLAGAAELMFDCTVPDFAPAPGIRSYRVSLHGALRPGHSPG